MYITIIHTHNIIIIIIIHEYIIIIQSTCTLVNIQVGILTIMYYNRYH